jgi:hypothetical protein
VKILIKQNYVDFFEKIILQKTKKIKLPDFKTDSKILFFKRKYVKRKEKRNRIRKIETTLPDGPAH